MDTSIVAEHRQSAGERIDAMVTGQASTYNEDVNLVRVARARWLSRLYLTSATRVFAPVDPAFNRMK